MIAYGKNLQDFLISLMFIVIIWESFLLIVSGFLGKKLHARLSVINWGPKLIGRLLQSFVRALANLIGAIIATIYQAILAPIGRAIRDLWLRIPCDVRRYIEIGVWCLVAIAGIVVYLKF